MSTSESGDLPADWLRLNAVCPYYTMFPLDFPLSQLTLYPDATRILDPFCGRGTTLYAARLVGRAAVGIDVNPVAAAIAQAKIVHATPEGVRGLASGILANAKSNPIPEGPFWKLCFHEETLREILALRQALSELGDTPTAIMLRALMLGALHGPRNKGEPSYFSNQMPRTYASKPDYAVRYWHKHGLKPVHIDTIAVLRRRAERVLKSIPPPTASRVVLGDAGRILRSLRGRFDLAVTSPPYYGMRTYLADQWLRNWFVGGPPTVSYETVGQLARQPSQAKFIEALACVWRATADRCRPGAHLVIRFGALPSSKVEPEKLLLASLREAQVGWMTRDVRPAGVAPGNRRQAEQFGCCGRAAVDEIDLTAELLPTRRPRSTQTR